MSGDGVGKAPDRVSRSEEGWAFSGPKVKICGLTRREDARFADGAGADYLGVILVPGTPRAVQVSEGREILVGLSAGKVAVMVNPTLEEARSWAQEVGVQVIQLHGEEGVDLARALKREGPWEIWKALRVRGPEDVREGLETFGPDVDGILLDGWHPGIRGGSGTTFPWEEIAVVGELFPPDLKLIAAGGLSPENVAEAVRHLVPQVVDVSSGVEKEPRIKDQEKIRAFLRNAGRFDQEGEIT